MAESFLRELEPPPRDEPLPCVRSLDLGGGEELALCWVSPGECRVGSRSAYPDERPVQVLELERGFWLARTAFTRGQWRALFGAVPEPAFAHLDDPDRHPRVNVTWFEALEACIRLQERFLCGLPGPVGPREAVARGESCRAVTWTADPGFRLPSEIEWEYACRGGSRSARGLVERPFGDGDEALDRCAWHLGNSGERTHPVDRDPEPDVPPHPFGLAQMIGNVWEWCLDLWWEARGRAPIARAAPGGHGSDSSDPCTMSEPIDARFVLDSAMGDDLPKSTARAVLEIYNAAGDPDQGLERLQAALDQQLPSGVPNRVLRGGSWNDPAWYCRSAFRSAGLPSNRFRLQGFRVCLLPGPGGQDWP